MRRPAHHELLESHWFPAVRGPRGKSYIVDHHHLGVALAHEGVETVELTLLDDLSFLDADTFLSLMEHRRWLHPFGADGRRRLASDLPRRLGELVADALRQPLVRAANLLACYLPGYAGAATA